MTKQKIESKLAKLGIPATYCGITALVITLLASQLGVCDQLGSLLTTANGIEITGVASGAVFLDFVAGTITLPAGSTAPLVRNMKKNLNDLGLNQCNSIGIWT